MNKSKIKKIWKVLKWIFLAIVVILWIPKIIDIPFVGIESKELHKFSIGIYQFRNDGDFLKVMPYPAVDNPVLTAKDVTDRKAKFVADPFLIYESGVYYMFFEVMDQEDGDIGLATSKDGIKWQYQKIVLDEPFHLSYPCIVKWGDIYYMVPESSRDRSVRLYKAEMFPFRWRFIKRLIKGNMFADPTIFHYQNKWWMFVSDITGQLYLYYADDLDGLWTEHPKSPVVIDNKNISRPAGNIINLNDKLIRITQDDFPIYGNSVQAFEIIRLDTQEYIEKPLRENPLLRASGKGWNKDGMHQLSVLQTGNKEWIASVDGQIIQKTYHIYGRLPDKLGRFLERLVK